MDAKSVKVYCEATAVFPLIVAATFAQPGGEEASARPAEVDVVY